jgi:molybdate transport system substrate-binding protein
MRAKGILMRTLFAVAISGVWFTMHGDIAARAADIKLFSPTAMKSVVSELVPRFESMSGHKAAIEYATVGQISGRLLKGEVADVAIISAARIDDLIKQGKVATGSRADLARVGVGVYVRAGAPKPDIGSADAFRRTLLNAKSVSYGDPAAGGVTGVHMVALMRRLDIEDDMKSKTKLLPNSQAVLEAVSRNEAEIGIGLTSDSALVSGVDLVGALPAEIQNFTLYAAGIASVSQQAEAGKALIGFLTGPIGHAALRAKGFEPR